MRKIISILLVSFCLIAAYSEEKPRTVPEIMADLKSYVSDLESLSDQRLQIIEDDKANIDALSKENDNIKASLNEVIIELSDANETIIRQDEKIKTLAKVLAIVSIVLGVFFVLHIVILILKLKLNITLPYWLNTLL